MEKMVLRTKRKNQIVIDGIVPFAMCLTMAVCRHGREFPVKFAHYHVDGEFSPMVILPTERVVCRSECV